MQFASDLHRISTRPPLLDLLLIPIIPTDHGLAICLQIFVTLALLALMGVKLCERPTDFICQSLGVSQYTFSLGMIVLGASVIVLVVFYVVQVGALSAEAIFLTSST